MDDLKYWYQIVMSLLILFSVTKVLKLQNCVTGRSQRCIHIQVDTLIQVFQIFTLLQSLQLPQSENLWMQSELCQKLSSKLAAVPELSQPNLEVSCMVQDHVATWARITAGSQLELIPASLGERSLRVGQTQAIHSADYLQQKVGHRQLGICQADTAVSDHRLSPNLALGWGFPIQVTRWHSRH